MNETSSSTCEGKSRDRRGVSQQESSLYVNLLRMPCRVEPFFDLIELSAFTSYPRQPVFLQPGSRPSSRRETELVAEVVPMLTGALDQGPDVVQRAVQS